MKKSIHLITIFLCLSQMGCLADKLKVPVEDHFIQIMTIVDGCIDGDYGQPCPEDMIDDLKMMKQQACVLDSITKSKSPDACEVEND